MTKIQIINFAIYSLALPILSGKKLQIAKRYSILIIFRRTLSKKQLKRNLKIRHERFISTYVASVDEIA